MTDSSIPIESETKTYAGISDDTARVLEEVGPYFEENLKRGFANAGVRAQRSNRIRYEADKLDDIFFTLQNNTIIELRNLSVVNVIDFRISDLSANLQRLNLDVQLNLSPIRIEGDYETNNASLQLVLPISNVGKLHVTLNDVKASGRVGLYVVEDSFVPKNYDLTFDIRDVSIKVVYPGVDEDVANEALHDSYENTLSPTFWRQLKTSIQQLLHLRLADVIVEISVTELLGGEQELIEDLREHSKQQAFKANRLFDSLLCGAKTYIVRNGKNCIETPPFDAIVWGKLSNQTMRVDVRATKGYLEDLSTLTRLKDVSVYETNDRLFLYGCITIGKFKHGYSQYEAKFLKTAVSGDIKSLIYANEIFVKFSMSTDNSHITKIERIEVITIRNVNVDVTKLGYLTWLINSKISTWLIGNLRHKAVPILEQVISAAFEKAVSSV